MGKKGNISQIRRLDNRGTVRPLVVDADAADRPEANGHDHSKVQRRKEKAAAEQRARSDAGSFSWSNLGGKLFIPRRFEDGGHKMSYTTILKILLSIRAASSFWSIILDCDEVYNFWEPLHLLLYGRGFQTWEYSPTYGIRSWAYIYLHGLIGRLLLPFSWGSKVTLFYLIRCSIALFSMAADAALYHSACVRLGHSVGSWFVVIHMFGVGVFNASCAFLPSSFGMTMNAFAMAAYLQEQWLAAIFCTAVGALLGMAMLVVRWRHLALRFVGYSLLAGAVVLGTMGWLDFYFYGKLVITPLNIVIYNVFSGHGPNLYGVEPASYYVKNLVLNWNVALLPALLSAPLAAYVFVRDNVQESKDGVIRPYWYRFLPVGLIFVTVLLWLGIFFWQPHKEERFLFPIFPLIALLAAVGLQSLYHVLPWPRTLTSAFVFLFTYNSFHKHFLLDNGTMDFSKMNNPIRLCVGKEWHRFPSSFFVPERAFGRRNDVRQVEIRFLASEFRGILPKHFEEGPLPDILRRVPTEMNDENREEPSRYVPLASCDYVIDLDTGEYTSREPDITNSEFLLAEKSHPLFRAFYIPLTNHRLSFGSYRLVKRADLRFGFMTIVMETNGTSGEVEKTPLERIKALREVVDQCYPLVYEMPRKGEGFELYNVNPKIAEICKTFRKRIHDTMVSTLRSAGFDCRANIPPQLESIEELAPAFDFLLDRAEEQFVKGPDGKLRPATDPAAASAGRYAKLARGELVDPKRVIAKPQAAFRDAIVNDDAPFVPKLPVKHNALRTRTAGITRDVHRIHQIMKMARDQPLEEKPTVLQAELSGAAILESIRARQLQANRYTSEVARLDCRFDQNQFKVDDRRPSFDERVAALFEGRSLEITIGEKKKQPLLPLRRAPAGRTNSIGRAEKIRSKMGEWATPYDCYLVAMSELEKEQLQRKQAEEKEAAKAAAAKKAAEVQIKVEPEEEEMDVQAVPAQPYRQKRGRGSGAAISEAKRKRKA
ncbi:Alg9 mannosyltransferase domain containing protein [Aphelenchoides fujianensis]|nr:Alg9 mannosyltransferase domain containing protein [Aphelenchoides fujianensis]